MEEETHKMLNICWFFWTSEMSKVRWTTGAEHDTTADDTVVSEKMAAGMATIQSGKIQTKRRLIGASKKHAARNQMCRKNRSNAQHNRSKARKHVQTKVLWKCSKPAAEGAITAAMD